MRKSHANRIKRLLAGLLAVVLLCSGNAGVFVYASEEAEIEPMAEVVAAIPEIPVEEDFALEVDLEAEIEIETEPETDAEGEPESEPVAEEKKAADVISEIEVIPAPELIACEICGQTEGHAEGCEAFVSEEVSAEYIEEENNLDAAPDVVETYSFSAVIHRAADYSDEGTELRSPDADEKAELADWKYETDRYLQVVLSNLDWDGIETYKLIIEMKPVLYATNYDAPAGTMVSLAPNEALPVNTSAEYLHDNSGTITYMLDRGVGMVNIPVSLRYDIAIWNKQEGALLWDEAPILLVKLVKVPSEGDEETVSEFWLDKAYAGEARRNDCDVGLGSQNDPNLSAASQISVFHGDEVIVSADQMNSDKYSFGHYYDEMIMELDLPRYTDSNNIIHYMKFEDLNIPVASGTADYTIDDSDPGKVKITLKNLYYSGNFLMSFHLSFPDTIDGTQSVRFSDGKMTITRDNGVLVSSPITVVMETEVVADVRKYPTSGSVNTHNLEYVQRLGTYGLRNHGNGDSGKLTHSLVFDAKETADMHVTTVLIMVDVISEYVRVDYTLVDKDGVLYTDSNGNSSFSINLKNRYYKKKPVSNDMYQMMYRSMLPQEQQEYFFKSVTYSIESVPANTSLYHSGANKAPYCGGTFWGYVDEGAANDGSLCTRATVYDNVAAEPLFADTIIKVELQDTMNVAYGMESPYTDKTVVEAGEAITIGGTIGITRYPYSSNTVLKQVRVGVLLPQGVSINEETVTQNGVPVDVTVEKQPTPVDGMYLWVVYFPEGKDYGYYNESLNAIKGGATIPFRMTLQTDLTVASRTIDLKDIVFCAGEKANNSASGSYRYCAVDEPQGYDLNGTGKVDKVSGFSASKTFEIKAAPAQLDITAGVRKDDDTSISTTSQLDHYADYVIYDLNIACVNGGSAEDFYYYIPVPGATELGTDMIEASPVGLEMQKAAAVTATGTPIELLYTVDTGLTYAMAKDAEWLTESQVTDWSKVTMMKVHLAAGYTDMDNGSKYTISIPFYFAKAGSLGETVTAYDYASYAGELIQWVSMGHYYYTNGANVFGGDFATDQATVTLTYTPWEEHIITLTAAQGETPTGKDASGTAEITVEVPFKNQQIYTIASMNTKDVTLVNTTAPISDARSNTDFGISVAINGGNAVDILATSVADKTIMGTSPAESEPKLTFTIHNGDALSDIVTERYVEIKLVGDNGVIIPVKIIINRELALAGDAEPAIQSGKEYVQITGGATSVTVSDSSAYTAQFVTGGLIPDNYDTRTLSFAHPAAGTTVVMIDWTDTSAPRYYHHTLSGSDTTVELTEFMEMGGTGKYAYPTGDQPVTERFLFIVDLPDDNSAQSGTIGLAVEDKNGTSETTDLSYTVATKRSFELTPASVSVKQGEIFTLAYTTSVGSDNDSRYEGRQAALVLTGTNIPSDARLVVGETSYYLNADGQFIIPLGSLSGSCTMAYSSCQNIAASLTAQLWVSANAVAANPMMGEVVAGPVSISIGAAEEPSMKVANMSQRAITRSGLQNAVSFTYQVKDASSFTATLEVQKKEGSGWSPTTTVLNTVDGNTATAGVYSISKTGGTLRLKFSEQTENGTYRILLRLKDKAGAVVLEVPYNFLVITD